MLDAARFDAITKLFEDFAASAAEEIDRAPLFEPWEEPPPCVGAGAVADDKLKCGANPPRGEPTDAEHNAGTTMAADIVVDFLNGLRPGGPWVLTAIHPTDESIETITARNADQARRFVEQWNGTRNLYYSVNPTRTARNKKASKHDIASLEFLFADLDPKETETAEAAKARYLAALEAFEPVSTAIVDSGNGLQVLWRLVEPIKLPEPMTVKDEKGKGKKVYAPDTLATIADVEQRVKTLIEIFDSKPGTQNIDRILRLPGTTNLPNAKKAREGRTACRAKLIKFNGATCQLADFPTVSGNNKADNPSGDSTNNIGSTGTGKTGGTSSGNAGGNRSIDWAIVEKDIGWLKGAADLAADFSPKGKAIIAHSGNLNDLNFDLNHAGVLVKPYQSWSEVAFALAAIFKSDGRYSNEQIAAALMAELECNRHISQIADGAKKRRAVERLILRSHTQAQPTRKMRSATTPDWREQRQDGSPLPSMHNARLAITALGIECSYDKFHNKLLFGFKDDSVRHAVEQIVGEVTDNGIIALRQLMSDTFGFDLTDKHTRDAVISLALEHCFDPVVDMLAEAEKNWDGVKRLDRMAADYLNCEDTKLNAAFIRKLMIAAVARARNPGCKFDNIVVLESPEGFNKSTVWRVLASDENFSDESILGKGAREVQEQLAEIWIHENAELAGMKKAEVEMVKAHASRQTDIARRAYDRFITKQKRHSIEVATTNSDQYLQSQTGNRRFWPLRVLKSIDVEKLRRDRLQLWGETAHYQSQGESLVLDEKLWGEAGIEQEARRITDPWEDVLRDMKEMTTYRYHHDGVWHEGTRIIIHHEDKEERVSSEELLTFLLNIAPGNQRTEHAMRLATVMKRLGWQRHDNGYVTINGKRMKGYFRKGKADAATRF
jgi:predicted P-loop ATPase